MSACNKTSEGGGITCLGFPRGFYLGTKYLDDLIVSLKILDEMRHNKDRFISLINFESPLIVWIRIFSGLLGTIWALVTIEFSEFRGVCLSLISWFW